MPTRWTMVLSIYIYIYIMYMQTFWGETELFGSKFCSSCLQVAWSVLTSQNGSSIELRYRKHRNELRNKNWLINNTGITYCNVKFNCSDYTWHRNVKLDKYQQANCHFKSWHSDNVDKRWRCHKLTILLNRFTCTAYIKPHLQPDKNAHHGRL